MVLAIIFQEMGPGCGARHHIPDETGAVFLPAVSWKMRSGGTFNDYIRRYETRNSTNHHIPGDKVGADAVKHRIPGSEVGRQ